MKNSIFTILLKFLSPIDMNDVRIYVRASTKYQNAERALDDPIDFSNIYLFFIR